MNNEKRVQQLEKRHSMIKGDSAGKVKRIFALWQDGKLTQKEIRRLLAPVFVIHPEWKHRPPGKIGRNAYIEWDRFTGYEHKNQ
jgi:hypothetical protein